MSDKTEIHFFDDSMLYKPDGMPGKFVNSEKGITKEIMDEYVKHLLDVINKGIDKTHKADKRIYILDTLREDRLIQMFCIYNDLENIGAGNYYNSKTGDYVSFQEIKKTIGVIRKAIIKKLADHMDPDDYYLILKDIRDPDTTNSDTTEEINPIFVVEGQKKDDTTPLKVYRGNKIPNKGTPSMRTAFEKLTKIPLHENVLNIHNQDTETLHTITEYLPKLKNINELVLRIKNIYDVKKILMIIDDNIKGAINLIQNDIVIMDICPINIGYIEEENKTKGVLFDLEACAMVNTKTKRFAHDRYFPPEYTKADSDDYRERLNITEKEPVYQFGKVISIINSILIPDELKSDYKRKINELCDSTLEMDPKKRPTLAKLHAKLEQIISLI